MPGPRKPRGRLGHRAGVERSLPRIKPLLWTLPRAAGGEVTLLPHHEFPLCCLVQSLPKAT